MRSHFLKPDAIEILTAERTIREGVDEKVPPRMCPCALKCCKAIVNDPKSPSPDSQQTNEIGQREFLVFFVAVAGTVECIIIMHGCMARSLRLDPWTLKTLDLQNSAE